MKWPFLLRRVTGESMLPVLRPGQIVLAMRLHKTLLVGDVVIITHEGKEKIKRIKEVQEGEFFVVGDNLPASTDSRNFGWLSKKAVIAKVWRPRV